MKKITLLCSFLTFATLGLTSCGSNPTPGPDTGGDEQGSVTNETIMDSFGDNFEISVKLTGVITTETLKRDKDIVHISNSSTESLYYNGSSYVKIGSSFMLYEEITDYDAKVIAWTESLVGTFMLEYTSAYFEDESGWVKSNATVLDRPATKYTLANNCEVYIDNATGASFKFVGLNEVTAMANFEVTSFSKGNVDLSSLIGQIIAE